MKRFIWAVGMVLAMGTLALADAVTLRWTAVPGATAYAVYQSVDLGATWTKVLDTANATANVNAPADKLVLYTISAKAGTVETRRSEAGLWYNGLWKLQPTTLIIE